MEGATRFSDPLRRHRLAQVVANLLNEGYQIVSRSDFRVVMARRRRQFLFVDEEQVILEVDEYGRVHRTIIP